MHNEHVVKQTWFHGVPSVLAATLKIVPFSYSGTLATYTGKGRFPIDASYKILGAIATVNTAPTGAAVIVDVKKNGTTIYTTSANKPTIAAAAFMSATAYSTPDITALALGDYLTIDIDQVGSTVAGADLTVAVYLQRIS